MKKILIIIFILLICFSQESSALSLHYKQQLLGVNNLFPVYDLVNENYSELPANLTGAVELGYHESRAWILESKEGSFFAGYIQREEKDMLVADETISYLIINSRDDLNFTKLSYELDASITEQLMDGIVLGAKVYSNDELGLDLTFRVELLRGLELRKVEYEGEFSYQGSEEGYRRLGSTKGVYSEINEEMTIHDIDFSSHGYSLSYGLSWDFSSRFRLNLLADNFQSEIKWKDVYTEWKEESISEGKSGRFDYEDYVTYLTARYELSLLGERSQWGVVYQEELYPYFNYQIWEEPVALRPGFFGDFYTLEVAYRGLEVQVLSRELDLFASSGVGIEAELSISF